MRDARESLAINDLAFPFVHGLVTYGLVDSVCLTLAVSHDGKFKVVPVLNKVPRHGDFRCV